jgi:hypothetical protein
MDIRKRNMDCLNVKVGFIELYSNGKEEQLGVVKPFEMKTHTMQSYTDHAYNTITVFKSICPNTTVYLVPPSYKGIVYLIENGIKVVNISLKVLDSVHYDKLADNAFVITSGGNDGAEGEWGLAISERVCAVAAVNDKLIPQPYSSYGKGTIKTCAVVGLNYGTGILHGTSFASPVITGLITQWFSWFENTFGVFPTVKQTNDFIKINSHDVFEDGKDLKTGYGLLRLPKQFEAESFEVKIGSNIGIVKSYIESDCTEKLIDLLYVPKVDIGRTVMSVADVSVAFNDAIEWNGETKTAKFIRG